MILKSVGVSILVASAAYGAATYESRVAMEKYALLHQRAQQERDRRSIQGLCEAYYHWRDDLHGGRGLPFMDQNCFDSQEMRP